MGLFDKVKKGVDGMLKTPQKPAEPEAEDTEEMEAVDEAETEEMEAEESAEEESGDEGREDMAIANSGGYERYLRAPDHFGPFDPKDLDAFMFAKFELEDAEMNDQLADKWGEIGVSGKEEWWQIEASFLRRHFGGLSNEELQTKYLQAAMNARSKQQMRRQQQAVAGDPSLMAPVDGVTVEKWAQAAAIMAREQDPAKQAQALAKLGMDRAKYDRANNEFQARMQRDTTFAIATVYGQAFSSAQGVEGGFGQGTVDGSAQKLGGEPVSFEKYCEIMGAQAAWGQTGADVNANLKKFFGITAMDFSAYAGYWSTKMQADVNLMLKQVDLMNQYQQKYMGAGGQDDDLDV